jgi:hypothetical protein
MKIAEHNAMEGTFYNDYSVSEYDPRIRYPNYMPMDRFIDLDELLSLDQYLIEQIDRWRAELSKDSFVNMYRLERDTPYRPGVSEIWLSRTRDGLSAEYLDRVGEPDAWEPTEAAEKMPRLMDFIRKLPFERTGRMIIIFDDTGKSVPAHRDHLDQATCSEFIWFRTNTNKRLYLLDSENGERTDVESYSAWFDTVNQYHGVDATPGLSFSFRVDGTFTDELRMQIPTPGINAASTPALWACTAI